MVEGSSENIIMIIQSIQGIAIMVDMIIMNIVDMVEGSSENIIMVIVGMVGMVDIVDIVDMVEGSSENKIIIGIETRSFLMMTMLIMITRIIWTLLSY